LSVYADASFLFSLYAIDAHSRSAAKLIRQAKPPLLLSELTQIEFVNALRLNQHRHQLTADETDELDRMFHEDIRAGILVVRGLEPTAFARATELSRKHTPGLGVRTLDILHVACAVTLGAKSFFTFDQRQAKLAQAAGLRTPQAKMSYS
jgi:predicted nucleic acid-binding protein